MTPLWEEDKKRIGNLPHYAFFLDGLEKEELKVV